MIPGDAKNYYEVLEIPLNSTPEEVREGYLRAKNAFSGDSLALYSLMDPSECDEIVVKIEEAYNILSDPEKRREYDCARGFNQQHYQNIAYGAHLRSSPFISPSHSPSNVVEGPNNGQLSGDFVKNEARKDFQIQRKESEVSKIAAKNRYSLEFEKNPEIELEIENATEFTGPFLKKIREYKGVSIERMVDMTKISKTYIGYIEAEAIEKLPALAYTRGFVYQMAKCLKLNPDLVANSFVSRIKGIKGNS